MSCTRMAFLLSELSPFVLLEIDFVSALCNSNTFQNIVMVLGRKEEQD